MTKFTAVLAVAWLILGATLRGQQQIPPSGGGGAGGTVNQGTPAADANAWPIKVTFGGSDVAFPLALGPNGGLQIECLGGTCGGAASFADRGAFTAGTSAVTNVGGVFNDGLADLASGTAGAPRMTKQRALHINVRDASGNEITPLTDAQLRASAVPISAASLPLPAGAATSANQATEIASLANVDVALSTRLKPADTLTAVTTVGTITNVVHVDDNGGSLTVDGPLTDAQLRASAVPISAATLPLPTGAATETTLALVKAKTDNIDVLLSTRATEATLAGVKTGTDKIPADPAREGGNLATVSTNTAPLLVAGAGGYVRQDSTATIAKETGGNLASIATNTTGIALNSAVTTLTTAVNQLHADLTNYQSMQGLSWVGGWPLQSARPGVPMVGIDQKTGTWISGFGSQNGLQVGVGPSGPNTQRVSVANDPIDYKTGTISSVNSIIGPLSLDGATGAECHILAGTLAATLLGQYSIDGVNFVTGTVQFGGTSTILPTTTNPNALAAFNPLLGEAARWFRIAVLIYTSGSANVVCSSSAKMNSPLAIPGLVFSSNTSAAPVGALETHDVTQEIQTCTFGWGGANAALGTTLTQCFALTANLRWYITDIDFISTTAVASTVQLKYGTGTNCATGTQNLTIAYPTPVSTAAAPTHFSWGSADGTAAVGNAICAVGGSATNTTQLKVSAYQAR